MNIYKNEDKDENEIFAVLFELFYDYVELHPTNISEPSFEEDMVISVMELLSITKNMDNDDDFIDTLYDFVDIVLPTFYETVYTRRSYSSSIILSSSSIDKKNIEKKISHLSSIIQPQQRTKEWYAFRNQLITASNLYKIFESQSQQNSLIYEKCNITTNQEIDPTLSVFRYVNTDSPLHWGQKYEPLSVMIYEEMYKTKVGEFGCIRHPKYHFIGASPDGINIEPSNNRYGRMLEIKNIVNREITGIPKKEYWIQMQLQMETCDLNECDFLETRFIEYENENLFLKDSDTSLFTSIQGERKGIILYFSNQVTGTPLYIYTPLHILSYEEYDKWSEELIENMLTQQPDLMWVRTIYWKLDEWSCVLVQRNKKWFTDVVPMISNFWDIIEKERITGYEHRAPIRRRTIII